MTQFVIGYGMGRCGTTSLARLLDMQPNSRFTHEMYGLHWLDIFSEYHKTIKALKKRAEKYSFVGDVNYCWAQYISQAIEHFPDVKLIHIWREKEETVESFWKANQNRVNAKEKYPIWQSEGLWLAMYPFFGYPPSKDQIASTYDVFHRIAEVIMYKHPKRVYTLHMNRLNDDSLISNLLDFVGIPKEDRVINRVQANKGGVSSTEMFVVPTEALSDNCQFVMRAGITLEASQKGRS